MTPFADYLADTPEPVPLYERFTVTYSASGTVIPSFYCGGVTLREVQVTHPLAVVEVVEASRVSGEADSP